MLLLILFKKDLKLKKICLLLFIILITSTYAQSESTYNINPLKG